MIGLTILGLYIVFVWSFTAKTNNYKITYNGLGWVFLYNRYRYFTNIKWIEIKKLNKK